jgi:DNA invertase Pin-like site-specific DNA recombinase
MKKILYTRVSSIDQNTDRQKINQHDFDLVIEDKCMGSIAFFDRVGGKQIQKICNATNQIKISVWKIDRLGRDLRDIINTIHFFTSKNIQVEFISQGFKTLNDDLTENTVSKLLISVLGIVAEMERNNIKENQKQGIEIAKIKGKYKGRLSGSAEDKLTFLSKPKNKKAVELLKKGYKHKEVATICNLNINTITKIKKYIK